MINGLCRLLYLHLCDCPIIRVGVMVGVVFFQAEDGIRDLVRSRGLGDVYKRQVLGGHGHRATVGRLEDVVRGQHEDAGLGLGLGRQRHVDSHLVAVEVGVERRAHERVDLDRALIHI